MALVGGVGTLIGPLLGGVVITFLQSVLGSVTERHLFVLGIIFILFVRFLPGGLFSLLRGTPAREPTP
jgi:branched-chain amino acid transport system permease protein